MSQYSGVHAHFNYISKKLTRMILNHAKGEDDKLLSDLAVLQDLSEKWALMYIPEEVVPLIDEIYLREGYCIRCESVMPSIFYRDGRDLICKKCYDTHVRVKDEEQREKKPEYSTNCSGCGIDLLGKIHYYGGGGKAYCDLCDKTNRGEVTD